LTVALTLEQTRGYLEDIYGGSRVNGPAPDIRKAAWDAKRGKIFTKIIRELVTAALEGGDPDA